MLTDRANVTIDQVAQELRDLEDDYRTRGKRLRALLAVLNAERPTEPDPDDPDCEVAEAPDGD